MTNPFDKSQWSEEEDRELGQTMLNIISQGGTVRQGLEAFAESSDVRTVDASKFRFFTSISKDEEYNKKYKEAKVLGSKARKLKKRNKTNNNNIRVEKEYASNSEDDFILESKDLADEIQNPKKRSLPIDKNVSRRIEWTPTLEKTEEITPETFLKLARLFQEQQKEKIEAAQIDKETVSELKKKNEDLTYKVRDLQRQLDDALQALEDKDYQLEVITNSFEIMKNLKDKSKGTYKVNSDLTVSK